MANYQQHWRGACAAGVVAAVAAGLLELAEPVQLPGIAAVGAVAGMAPDIDSQTSRPQRILGQGAAVILPSCLIFLVPWCQQTWLHSIGVFLLGWVLVRYPVMWCFNRLTTHRGALHTLQAVLAVAGLGLVCAELSGGDRGLQLGVALASGLGYLTHLVMDEVWAVDFNNRKLKRSFGTALSLTGSSSLSTGLITALGVAACWKIWETLLLL